MFKKLLSLSCAFGLIVAFGLSIGCQPAEIVNQDSDGKRPDVAAQSNPEAGNNDGTVALDSFADSQENDKKD